MTITAKQLDSLMEQMVICTNALLDGHKCKRCKGTGRTDDGPFGPTTNLGSVFPGTKRSIESRSDTPTQPDPWCLACDGKGH